MYRLLKRCYIHGILIVHVIKRNPYVCYFQRILSDSILNECNAVSYLNIVQLVIEKMLSLSDMYHDTFINQKK